MTPADRTLSDDGGPSESESLGITTGTNVGRYRVEHQVGAGGMGVVYAAFDPELDRRVAVKVLRVPDDATYSRPSAGRARLLREAQAMAQLAHRNVITVYDVGEHEGHVFLAMEFIQGMTLTAWARTPRSVRELVDVFVEAGRGLAHAHAAGLVHRDFKPDNVMIVPDAGDGAGRVLVMDFGLARAAVGSVLDVTAAMAIEPNSAELGVTRTGQLLGTPAYMAPEQHTGGVVDERSDQFAYCVSLFELVYGVRPFAGDNAMALACAVLEGNIREVPGARGVRPWLRHTLTRGLSPSPGDRFASMDDLVRELAQGVARERRRVPRLAAAAIVGTAIVGGTWVASTSIERHTAAGSCASVERRLDTRWSDPQRTALREAFAATHTAYAEATADRVVPQLDAWASAWADSRGEACRQSGDASEPELHAATIACLEDRARQFEQLVDAFATADATVVEHAVESVDHLPAVTACGDATWLGAQMKPPEDPSLAVAVAELQARLDAVAVLERTGQYTQGEKRGASLLTDARALGYAPILAEAAYLQGQILLELADVERAAAVLEEAYLTAGTCGHGRIAALAAIDLVDALGVVTRDPERAHAWLKHAQTQVARQPEGDDVRSKLLSTEAMLAWSEEDFDTAAATSERALELARTTSGEDSLAVARELGSLGLYETKAGRLAPAKEHLTRSVELLERDLGPSHPTLASALGNLGMALNAAGEPDRALACYRRALAIVEAAFGPDSAAAGGAVQNLAIVLAEQGNNAEALPMFERALAIRTAAFGPEHPTVGAGHLNLGISLGLAGRDTEGAEHLRRALAIMVALDDRSPTVGMIRFELGNRMRALGQLDAALVEHEAAHEILVASVGEQHPLSVTASASLAATLRARGEDALALARLESAHTAALAIGMRPVELAPIAAELGTLLWEQRKGERARARALVEEAVAAMPESDRERKAAIAWLASHRVRG